MDYLCTYRASLAKHIFHSIFILVTTRQSAGCLTSSKLDFYTKCYKIYDGSSYFYLYILLREGTVFTCSILCNDFPCYKVLVTSI